MKNEKLIQRWIKEVENKKRLITISLPLNILLEEASVVSGFIEEYWDETNEHPGLSSAKPIVSLEMAEEITALVRAISESHNNFVKTQQLERGIGGAGLKAQRWIREIQHLLKWAERRQEMAGKPGLSIDLARYNRDYLKAKKNAESLYRWISIFATAARMNEASLSEVPGYNPAMLAEGAAIQKQLSQTRKGRPRGSDANQRALSLRRQLTHVLAERIRRVRSAARFVFRDHPRIRRLVTSDFERQRRRRNRKSRKGNVTAPE